jgi:hypothetical protein
LNFPYGNSLHEQLLKSLHSYKNPSNFNFLWCKHVFWQSDIQSKVHPQMILIFNLKNNLPEVSALITWFGLSFHRKLKKSFWLICEAWKGRKLWKLHLLRCIRQIHANWSTSVHSCKFNYLKCWMKFVLHFFLIFFSSSEDKKWTQKPIIRCSWRWSDQ